MKTLIRLEEFLMFILGIILFSLLHYSWWIFVILILAPDISMVGYTVNNKVGAYSYNFFHHKGVAIGIYLIGWMANWPIVTLVGIILFSHASLDRIFNYGLKFVDSFQHTHMGWIGEREKK